MNRRAVFFYAAAAVAVCASVAIFAAMHGSRLPDSLELSILNHRGASGGGSFSGVLGKSAVSGVIGTLAVFCAMILVTIAIKARRGVHPGNGGGDGDLQRK